MYIRISAPMTTDSIVDGPGLRAVIWTQGCTSNCKGCHNKQTQDLNGGFMTTVAEINRQIDDLKLQKGITISGGEPFLQSEQCGEIAKYAKSKGLDVWCFTGFIYEQLKDKPEHKTLLENIDVLVDGPFIEEQKSYELNFKGSRNQRTIYLDKGEIVRIDS